MEIQGKAHFLAIFLQENDVGTLLFEQLLPQQFLRGDHLMLQLFIHSQRPDKLQNQRGILRHGGAECHLFHPFLPFPPFFACSYFS